MDTNIKDAANEIMTEALRGNVMALAYAFIDAHGTVRSGVLEGDGSADPFQLLGAVTFLQWQVNESLAGDPDPSVVTDDANDTSPGDDPEQPS